MRTRTRVRYSREFKQAAVAKLLSREGRSQAEIIEELGISRASVSRWVSEFGKNPEMNNPESAPRSGKRSQDYTASEKLEAVMEYRRLKEDPHAQGEYLRRQGLYGTTVELWEREMLEALGKPGRRPKQTPEEAAKDRRITELERDLRRKEKALAETTALLVLKKKADAIWGHADDEESA